MFDEELMIQDSYNILTEMLTSFKLELSDINSKIHLNELSIKEEEACVKSLKDNDTEDFDFFYPRKGKTILKLDEIEKSIKRKHDYEEQNRNLINMKAVLETKIKQLEQVLRYECDNFKVSDVQMEDRRRIARDLHDTSLQSLVHLIHKIELCNLYIDQDSAKAKQELAQVSVCLKEAVDEIRNTILDLRTMNLDKWGLKTSLEQLLAKINTNGKYEIISDIDDVSCENNSVYVYIYRIAQESLNNIVKHANADRIFFKCKSTENVCVMDIEDNGKGFNDDIEGIKSDKHFGLSLMRERVEYLNGKINIFTSIGEGTKIHIEIPLAG